MTTVVHVAAAAILGADGRLLLSRRPDHAHQGGLWEFPGGKLEAGETASEALCRELSEELGITPEHYQPLIRIPYSYPDKTVLLDVWRVSEFSGEPHGREGQPLKWLAPQELNAADFPAANKPIIDALLLPDKYLITGAFDSPQQFEQRLQRALDAGIRMVQLRPAGCSREQTLQLAAITRRLCTAAGALFIFNGSSQLAGQVDADGLHLNFSWLRDESPDLRAWSGKWLGASCHNEQELHRAIALGARYVSLSPVLPTATHPDESAMGWQRFQTLVEQAQVPVFALGGMGEELIGEVRSCGGQGIAAIREYWK